MGMYIAARICNDEGVLDYAPMQAFIGNSLVGTYSNDMPLFKLTGRIRSALRSIGYVIEGTGKVFSIMEIIALYGALYRKLMEQEGRATHETADNMLTADIRPLLHFLGTCLANQWLISID